jgi:hypothetical protein
MAIVFADRVKVRSYSTGTAEFILESVVPGFQSFAAIGDGNQCYYGIEDHAGNWEVGLGTYDIDSTQQFLFRTTVISSSNSNNLVSFPEGGKSVYTTIPSSVAANIIASTTFAFRDIAVAGQSTVSADSTTDTLTLVAGTGIDITTNAGTDTITIAADTGAIEFAGSTISTNDSSGIIIDQAVTLESNVTVGGDILPKTDNGGSLGSPSFKWKELFVSNGSIYIGDIKLSNVGGKLAAVKVINPGEANEAEDPEDSDAASEIGGGSITVGNGTDTSVSNVTEILINGTITEIEPGIVGITVSGGAAGDANVWVQTFETQDGAPTDVVSLAVSVEYDDAGNVIALFSHYSDEGGGPSGTYYSVGKYTTTGAKIWTARFQDGFDTDGWGLAVDNDSNSIYVAGEDEAEGGQFNATLTKIDGTDGSVVWSKSYDFGFNSQSAVVDVASDGNPVMVGYAYNGTDNYVATTKVDAADGSIIWSRSLDGQDDEEAYGMAVGPSGEVVVIGYMDQLGEEGDTDDHMLVVKYNSAGAIQWQKAILFDAEFSSYGADADIDSDGNIYVTGNYQYYDSDNDTTTSALSILKLDGTGAKQWSRRVQGDCETVGVSVVVGADDKLYLSGITGDNNDENNAFTWVAAKYGIDGTVEWQRLIDNTTGWTFTGGVFFSDGGGSNIAVKQDYVLLGGGFGNLAEDIPRATVVQVSAAGDVFSVGDWDFKAASFSGVLSADASDITVVNAGKTDTDNSENITTSTVTLTTEVSGFLIGTLYRESGGDDRLVNSGNELVLEANGALTLPSGGTISEGYVTSNPTIQLTPATPEVASQKLVIKGGTNYNFTDNGITLSYQDNTANNGDSLDFYINGASTYANQTLYWWIYPTDADLTTPSSGTVALDENGGGGPITFTVDSENYEFRVRVSPEEDNYDPASVGVESGLINADAPTFEGDHHLHLTTGDLSVTSIILGTDNHNVRTTVDGGISMTTTRGTVLFGNTPDNPITGSSHFHIMKDDPNNVDLFFGDDYNYVKLPTTEGVEVSANGSSWTFSTDGNLTIPGDIRSEGNINIDINLGDSTLRRWRFGEDGDLTFPDNTVQTTAYTGNTTATTPTTTGIPNGFALDAYTNTNLTPGNYSNILVGFDGKNVTLGVQVSSEYNITIFGITNASPATFIISDSAVIPGNLIGGATPTDDLTIIVDSLETVAIDLTKTINKLTDGDYVLGDGVEGQIMYIVRQNGSTAANISVVVANARWDGLVYSDQLVVPFQIPFTDMVTIIFTDGAWQSSTFGSLT